MQIPIIAVVGPTASGKTALAVKLAKHFNGEIISADSMQIYKYLDIATAKPDDDEKDGIPHHLMDFLEPDERFSVSQYKKLADKAAEDIYSRGKIPVLVGGTGLYVDNFLNSVELTEYELSMDIREKLLRRADEEGTEKLYEELKAIDPEAAKRINPNDKKRIIRAHELYEATGVTITQQNEASRLNPTPYKACVIGLNAVDRDVLYSRINLRVDKMADAGLLEETKNFYSKYTPDTAGQAIGYKELLPYLNGEKSLEECLENLKMATRRYAKRQLTWFRRNENINWIYIDSKGLDEITTEAIRIINESDLFTEDTDEH